MIKVLFSAEYEKIAADSQTAEDWGVDQVMQVANLNFSKIPYDEDGSIYFVPVILDANMALSYEGVRLALKIYFYSLRDKKYNFKIILMGQQTLSGFLITYPFPNIMKCQGIDYILFNKKLVNDYDANISTIKSETLIPELKNIGLTLPESFKTHHSLTNEWSLYVWSKFIWGDNIPIELPNSESLYFSYLKTLYSLDSAPDKGMSKSLEEKFSGLRGKILLIDDNPKWGEFFHKLFAKSPEVKFRYIGDNFKNIEIEDILNSCAKEVTDFEPDIIFLDFRLSEDQDYEEKNNKKISGAKVLEYLKGDPWNPGIAFDKTVLIFTATGKIENLIMLKNLNADGFIPKERPGKYLGKTSTAKLFTQLIDEIHYRIEWSYFFEHIEVALKDLEVSKNKIKVNEEYAQKIHTTIYLIRNLQLSISALSMGNTLLAEGYLKLMYLEFISLLETLKHDRSELNLFIKDYLSNIIPEGFLNEWDNMCDIRNAIAHGSSEVKLKTNKEGKYEVYLLEIDFLKKWNKRLANFVSDTFKILIQHKKFK